MDSIAPTVRSGQSDQAIFAEVNISMTAVPMSDAAKAKFGDDTKAYERAFRAHIVRSLMNCFELELAILEGDSAKAKTLATRLVEGRNASHDLFEQ